MSIRTLGLAAVVTGAISTGALAQETWDNIPHTVQAGETLSEISNKTWLTVTELMNQNPDITARFWTVCAGVKPGEWFCTEPQHTIFPWDKITASNTKWQKWENTDLVSKLSDSGVSNPTQAAKVIQDGIVKIPWLTEENAIKIITELEKIPKHVNVALIIDVSGSTNDDRFLISNFLQFVLEDRKLASAVVEQTQNVEIGKTTCYGYSLISEEIPCDTDFSNISVLDGFTENTVSAISKAYASWSKYFVIITDERWDDNEMSAINKDNTTILIISWDYCDPLCWNDHKYYGKGLVNHWKIVYLAPSSVN